MYCTAKKYPVLDTEVTASNSEKKSLNKAVFGISRKQSLKINGRECMRYHRGHKTLNLSIWETSMCSNDCVLQQRRRKSPLSQKVPAHSTELIQTNIHSCDNIYIWSRRSFDFFCHDYQVLEMHRCAKYLWNQRCIAILLYFGLTKCILRAHLKCAVLHLLSQPHNMEKIRGWVWEWRRGLKGMSVEPCRQSLLAVR